MPRIETVRFRLPQGKPGYILVRLVNGREIKFFSGEMLSEMQRLKLLRFKVAIIHSMAYERAISAKGDPSPGVLELLAEFHIAAEAFGADPTKIHRKG
jgi:hypothetical protein